MGYRSTGRIERGDTKGGHRSTAVLLAIAFARGLIEHQDFGRHGVSFHTQYTVEHVKQRSIFVRHQTRDNLANRLHRKLPIKKTSFAGTSVIAGSIPKLAIQSLRMERELPAFPAPSNRMRRKWRENKQLAIAKASGREKREEAPSRRSGLEHVPYDPPKQLARRKTRTIARRGRERALSWSEDSAAQ